jgi:hypothetical protein
MDRIAHQRMKQGSRNSPDVRSVEVVSSTDVQVPMSPRARALRPVAPVERILYTREEAATALGMSVDTFERRVQPFIRVVPCGALVQVPPDELRRWARENARSFFKQTA